MLKITAQKNGAETVFELEGKLAGPWVGELKECWQKSARGSAPMTVHLCGVTFIDAEGKSLLTEMYRGGAALIAEGCMNKAIVEEITGGGRP
jgi:hypothetical protein